MIFCVENPADLTYNINNNVEENRRHISLIQTR